jgi:hypothetical protein
VAYKNRPAEVKRARRYDQQAVNKCFQLYLRFNGQHHDKIAEAMREDYPHWRRENLYGVRGWIQKYAWDEALRLKVESDKKAALNSADQLVGEIEFVREKLYTQIKQAGTCDDELISRHRDYCKLSIEALTKVKEAQDTLGGFVAMWERLVTWLGDYSPHALEALLQTENEVMKRAAEELGSETEAQE